MKYREWDAPWPLIVFARGEGKTTTRVWPLYSRAHNATLESSICGRFISTIARTLINSTGGAPEFVFTFIQT